ncbi:YifB family Mg chelatase-like AAA ATPase [Mariniluteicoccus flavus]
MSRMARAFSVALSGLDGQVVGIEAAVGGGLPRTVLVGLPDTALYESRDRCRAAVASSGHDWPQSLVTINLTPAALPKAGSHYDVGIAAAVLAAAGAVPLDSLAERALLGELGLDGRVRPVRGVLPALLAARDAGFPRAIVPLRQVAEASLVDGIAVQGVDSLTDLVNVLRGAAHLVADPPAPPDDEPPAATKDMADVVGQAEARHAIEVAAAGGHHLSLRGAPGVGKTMLAERLIGILPELPTAEALEVAAVRSLAGLHVRSDLDRRPPYADPHHSASVASIVGGGTRIARPGSVSLAHRGVLFMDEAPEFSPRVLDALRTPLESGSITIGRSGVHATYPARFQLVLASNPCPCGLSLTPGADCRCGPYTVHRYRERLSGPILDRLDIHQTLHPLRSSLLREALGQTEGSAAILARVVEARSRAARRLTGTGWRMNGEVPGPFLRSHLPTGGGSDLIDDAVARGQVSARGVDKCLRLAWTLADLHGHDVPSRSDVRQAIMMRRGDGLATMGAAS